MSALRNFGAVAGGVLGGMNMRAQLDQRKLEEERQRQELDMRRQEFEARQEDRASANQERANTDNFYSGFGAQKFMQPGMTPTDPNAPDEPTMGVERASQTPRSEIAKIGMTESMDYDAAARRDAETLNQFKMQAYQLKGADRAAAIAALNDKKAELLNQYASAFPGDPTKSPRQYTEWMARKGALLGDRMTPAQAIEMKKFTDAYEEKGVIDALDLAHRGDFEGARKVYCANGGHCFDEIKATPSKSATGLDSYTLVGIKNGQPPVEIGNALDAMLYISNREQAVKLALEAQDKNADNKREDEKLGIERAKLGILRQNQRDANGSGGGKQKDDSLSDSDMQRLFPGSPNNKFVGGKLSQEPGIDRAEYNKFAAWAANNDLPVSVNSHSKWVAAKKPSSARPQSNSKPFNVNEFMRK